MPDPRARSFLADVFQQRHAEPVDADSAARSAVAEREVLLLLGQVPQQHGPRGRDTTAHTTGVSPSTYGTRSNCGSNSRFRANSSASDSGTWRTPPGRPGWGLATNRVPAGPSRSTVRASASERNVKPSAAGVPVTSKGTPRARKRLNGLSSPT